LTFCFRQQALILLLQFCMGSPYAVLQLTLNITDFLRMCLCTPFLKGVFPPGASKRRPLPRIFVNGTCFLQQTLYKNFGGLDRRSSPLGVQFHRGMGGICFVCFSDFHQYGPCHLSIFFRWKIFRLYECHSCFGELFFC